jgi:hypothetical protein
MSFEFELKTTECLNTEIFSISACEQLKIEKTMNADLKYPLILTRLSNILSVNPSNTTHIHALVSYSYCTLFRIFDDSFFIRREELSSKTTLFFRRARVIFIPENLFI